MPKSTHSSPALVPKRYVLFYEDVFTERDWLRYGCHDFLNSGIDVCVYDISRIAFGTLSKNVPSDSRHFALHVSRIETENELKTAVSTLNQQSDFIVVVCGLKAETVPFYQLLKKFNVQYYVLSLAPLPMSTAGANLGNFLNSPLDFLNLLLLSFSLKSRFLLSKIKKLLHTHLKGLQPPIGLIHAGTQVATPYWPIPLYLQNRISVGSFDFCQYVDIEAQVPTHPNEPYYLFVDEGMVIHPDFKLHNIKHAINEDSYFSELKLFFDFIEKKYNTRILIAGHPRCKYADQQKCFGNREVIYGKTPQLIRGASLIIAHASTALGMAALFAKPVQVIRTHELKTGHMSQAILLMASWFSAKIINISQLNNDTSLTPCTNPQLRQRFIKTFMSMDFDNKVKAWPLIIKSLKKEI